MNTVWRVFVYLKRYPLLAFAMMACAITGTLMLIVFTAVTKWILDEVVTGHHPERLLPLLAVAAVAALLQNSRSSAWHQCLFWPVARCGTRSRRTGVIDYNAAPPPP